MAWYRLYFLSGNGDIRNVDEYNADNDEKALVLADGLHDAVSDLYAGYELWRDSKRIFRCTHAAARPFLPQQVITREMQASLLQREDILQKSASAFSRSQRLLERMKAVGDAVGGYGRRPGRPVQSSKQPLSS